MTPVSVAIIGSRGYPSTYGGFETFVRNIAPWLAGRGHQVTVYGRSRRPGAPRVTECENGVRSMSTLGINGKSTSTLTHALTASFHCARTKPDVVLALNVATASTLPILRARSIPVVMNVDGIEWSRGKWGVAARTAFRGCAWLSTQFDGVTLVADSREVANIWEQKFGRRPQFIPYGAPIRKVVDDDRIRQLGLSTGSFALVVARLAPENSVDLFLDAMDQACWPYPVVVVGSANYPNPVEQRLKDLHRAGKLQWLGHVADQTLLSQLWAHSGAYFHGHTVGGTNPALLQALGLGAPVVAVDTPFNREVLGPDGTLVDSKPDAVASAVTTLVREPESRKALSEHGRKVVEARYRWADVFSAYERALSVASQQ